MREKETYRDNLALVTDHFGAKRMLSINDAAEFLGLTSDVLKRDKRFSELMIDYGRQRRISTASLARWMS